MSSLPTLAILMAGRMHVCCPERGTIKVWKHPLQRHDLHGMVNGCQDACEVAWSISSLSSSDLRQHLLRLAADQCAGQQQPTSLKAVKGEARNGPSGKGQCRGQKHAALRTESPEKAQTATGLQHVQRNLQLS